MTAKGNSHITSRIRGYQMCSVWSSSAVPFVTVISCKEERKHRGLFPSHSATMSPHVSDTPMVSPLPQSGSISSTFPPSSPSPDPWPASPALSCLAPASAAWGPEGCREWLPHSAQCLAEWDSWFVAPCFIQVRAQVPGMLFTNIQLFTRNLGCTLDQETKFQMVAISLWSGRVYQSICYSPILLVDLSSKCLEYLFCTQSHLEMLNEESLRCSIIYCTHAPG